MFAVFHSCHLHAQQETLAQLLNVLQNTKIYINFEKRLPQNFTYLVFVRILITNQLKNLFIAEITI